MIDSKPLISLFLLFFSFLVTNETHSLVLEKFYPFIEFNLPIYWILKSLMVRVWSLVINLMAKVYDVIIGASSANTVNGIKLITIFKARQDLKTPTEKIVSNNDVVESKLEC